jgi:hypothetical protein
MKLSVPLFVAMLLAACGGSGGDDSPPPPNPPGPPALPSQTPIGAWIGANDSLVTLPTSVNGARFIRARDRNCNLTNFSVCTSGQMNPLTGVPVTDTAATTAATAYYWLEKDGTTSRPTAVNTRRFSERFGHAALFFNNRYWVIGGWFRNSAGAKADVWSSVDGKVWELETNAAAFGARGFHQSVVYNGRMWVIGGINSGGQLVNDVYSSTDGVVWAQVGVNAPFNTATHEDLNVAVFNNAMWAVFNGAAYSSTDGVVWTQRSVTVAGGQRRGYASLTAFNNRLWYVAGAQGYNGSAGNSGTAMNDVWSSTDGILWTQVNASAAFAPRLRHAAFVLNNRLWVFGGQTVSGGTIGALTPNAWSSADGITWTQEAMGTQLDRSYMWATVQETNKVTLIGGLHVAYSTQVWQSTDGNQWTLLSPYAQFSPRDVAAAVSFQGDLWLFGGYSGESTVTNEIWRTSDGLTWTRVTPIGTLFSPRDSHQVVVFNGRLWVIGGWDDFVSIGGTETRTNDVWSSADGVNWTRHNPVGATFSPRAGQQAVVFNSRLWVIGGSTGATTNANDVWSSVDGVNWVQENASAAFSPRHSHRVAVHNGSLWLFAGESTSVLADTWRSTDGVNWTLVTPVGPSFAARLGHTVVTHNNRIWLLGGESSTDFATATRFNDVWSTTDGVSWMLHTAAAQFNPRTWHSLVSHNNELWVIGGFNLDLNNEVWRSTDGVNWRVGFNHSISTP